MQVFKYNLCIANAVIKCIVIWELKHKRNHVAGCQSVLNNT